jgi:Domain of unknown function (DUF222)/HNH endonuclease
MFWAFFLVVAALLQVGDTGRLVHMFEDSEGDTEPGEPGAAQRPAREPELVTPEVFADEFARVDAADAAQSDGRVVMAALGEERALEAVAAARKLELVARLYRRPEMIPLPARRSGRARYKDLTAENLTHEEVRMFFALTRGEATRLVDTAVMLTTRLPRTMAALKAGHLGYDRAARIARHAKKVTDHHYRQARRSGVSPHAAERVATAIGARLEELVLGPAAAMLPWDLEKALIGAVILIDPAFAAAQRKDQHKGRSVSHRTNPGEGTGDLFARLPAAEALAIFTAVDAYARAFRTAGDPRTLDELRADVLVSFFFDKLEPVPSDADDEAPDDEAPADDEAAADDESFVDDADLLDDMTEIDEADPVGPAAERCPSCGHPPGADTAADVEAARGTWRPHCRPSGKGLRAHVVVTVELSTLLRLDNRPGELAGHGPIDAEYARTLAFGPDSTWRRLVTDPVTGQLLDYGRSRYRPPAPLADHVRARDGGCRTPGCRRPADVCDVDHVVPYPAGTTSEDNLCTRCRHDHRLKHEGRWKHEVSTDPADPPSTIVLTSPMGQKYTTHAHVYIRPRKPSTAAPTDQPQENPWTVDGPVPF